MNIPTEEMSVEEFNKLMEEWANGDPIKFEDLKRKWPGERDNYEISE